MTDTSSMILPNCVIVDVSHWQTPATIDWKSAHDNGNVRGAIVKLIQNGVPDQAFIDHLYSAYEAGIELLGIYDFGTASDDHVAFLNDALSEFSNNLATRLLVLDAEKSSVQMTVSEAEGWVTAINDSQKRYPTLYMGRDGPDGTGAGLPSGVLSRCSLWLPAYGDHASDLEEILPPGFKLPSNDVESAGVLRLWQFTGDGINMPENWPDGIPSKCDLSYAVGFSSFAALSAWWGS